MASNAPRLMRLPNGQRIMQINPAETSLQYRNIFVHGEYLLGGISLRPGAVLFDIGANVGLASLFFRSLCPDTRIYAFEPADLLFDALRANLAATGADARVYHAAVGASPGTATLVVYPRTTAMSGIYADPQTDRAVTRIFLSNTGFEASDIEDMTRDAYVSVSQECQVTTVSAVIAEEHLDRIDLLKINVEKAEADVLAGVHEQDWPKIHQVVMQVHDTDKRLERIRATLEGLGFTVVIRQDPLLRGTGIHDLAARRMV